jgi:hypothetical protein
MRKTKVNMDSFKQKWQAFWSKAWSAAKSAVVAVLAALYDLIVWVYKSILAILTAVTDAVASSWSRFKADPFGFKEYGESLMTEKVRRNMKRFAWILAIQFVIDFVAWGRVGAYGFPTDTMGILAHFTAMVFIGLAFAMAILLFDVTVVTLDTSKSRSSLWPLLGRAVILFAISFVTAIPVELTLYEPAITRRLEGRQKTSVDAIRAKAIAEEEASFAKKIASSENELVKISEGYTLLKKRVAEYLTERASQRKQVEEQRKAGADSLQKSIDEQRKAVNDEMDGTGGSGHRGKARIADYKEALLAKLVSDKNKYDTDTKSILADFDKATGAGTAERESALTQKSKDDETAGKVQLAAIRSQKDQKIAGLRTMPAEELSQKYGGDWKKSFDFLTRYRELASMAEEDPLIRWSVWGCRLVLIALGLLILLLKAMAPEEMKRYFSFGAQAANGVRSDVVRQAEVAGYHDADARKALGFSIKYRDLLQSLGAARRKLAEAYARWCQQAQTLASEINSATGFHYHLEVLHSMVHDLWVKQEHGYSVMECALALERVEEKCRLNGLALPPWPDELGKDPRKCSKPWNISEDDAVLYGWTDPTPALLLQKASKLSDARHKLVQAYFYFRSNMMYWCQERIPKGAPAKILPLLYLALTEQWRGQVLPAILNLEKVEQECRSAGMAMPCWPAELGSDPRTLDQPWQPPPDELIKLGWADPESASGDISKAKAEVFRLRAQMESRVAFLNFDIAQWVIQNPGKTAYDCFKECSSARLDSWRNEITRDMNRLAAVMRVLEEAGEEMPPWNPEFNPGPNGWLITEELLSHCGWVKPSPAAQAKEQYHSLCSVMERLVEELNFQLAAFIRNNPGMSTDEIRAQLEPARFDAWETVIRPSCNELADAAHKIITAGEAALGWAPDFNPGPLGWQLDTDLLVRYGWAEPPPPPAELPVPEPEPAEDPPPSAPPADDIDPSDTGT